MKKIVFSVLILLSFVVQAEDPRPNILFVIVDDLGRQDVGVYGSAFYETPNLDALAKQGMKFNNAYVAHPRCVPSRIGIMSGQYPARLGVPGKRASKHPLPINTVTFAEHLQQAGYNTGYIGKWHLGGSGGKGVPSDQGFDVSVLAGKAGAPPSYYYPYDKARKGKSKGFSKVDGAEGDYLTDRLTDEAIGFISREREEPFMLVLAHYAVHTPIEGKPEKVSKYSQKIAANGIKKGGQKWDSDVIIDGTGAYKTVQNNEVYAAMIESVDEGLGRIFSTLEEQGLADNTIVILTSDHGGLSSRGLNSNRELATSNLPYRHGKGWLYNGGIGVPLLVKWPGKIMAGSVSEVQVTGTDHYPTILQMAGLPLSPEDHTDGVSYLDALAGKDSQRPNMYWHSPLARPYSTGDTNSSAVISGEWKLIDWYEQKKVELFNLKDDSAELHDLSKTNPEKTSELLSDLHVWMKSVNAQILNPENDKKRKLTQTMLDKIYH